MSIAAGQDALKHRVTNGGRGDRHSFSIGRSVPSMKLTRPCSSGFNLETRPSRGTMRRADLTDLKRGSSRRRGRVVSQGAVALIQLISTVVLARLLSPDDYGILAMVVAVTSFARLFRRSRPFSRCDSSRQAHKRAAQQLVLDQRRAGLGPDTFCRSGVSARFAVLSEARGTRGHCCLEPLSDRQPHSNRARC